MKYRLVYIWKRPEYHNVKYKVMNNHLYFIITFMLRIEYLRNITIFHINPEIHRSNTDRSNVRTYTFPFLTALLSFLLY